MDRTVACINHDDNRALERCEECGAPLCGECLWYSDDGHRLCETHARAWAAAGRKVLPPETYAEAIDFSILAAGAVEDDPPGTIKGNQTDLNGLFAAAAGVGAVLMCTGWGAYCLPIGAVILGIFAYSRADLAQNPSRTRKLAGVGIASGAVFLFFIAAIIAIYIAVILFAVLASGP